MNSSLAVTFFKVLDTTEHNIFILKIFYFTTQISVLELCFDVNDLFFKVEWYFIEEFKKLGVRFHCF